MWVCNNIKESNCTGPRPAIDHGPMGGGPGKMSMPAQGTNGPMGTTKEVDAQQAYELLVAPWRRGAYCYARLGENCTILHDYFKGLMGASIRKQRHSGLTHPLEKCIE